MPKDANRKTVGGYWLCSGCPGKKCGYQVPRGKAWCDACGHQPPAHVSAVRTAARQPIKPSGNVAPGGQVDAGAKKAIADAERRAKTAEAKAAEERKARLAAEAVAAASKDADMADGPGVELTARQKQLRSELKELRGLSATLYDRLCGGPEGHAIAVQKVQAELDGIAATKRGELPLQQQLESQKKHVDHCTRSAASAKSNLEQLEVKRKELGDQILEASVAVDMAASKRAEAEAHLSDLHARIAQQGAPAPAAPPQQPAGFTADDYGVFMGLLQHVSDEAIRASCAAAGRTEEDVLVKVRTLAGKFQAAAASSGPEGQAVHGPGKVDDKADKDLLMVPLPADVGKEEDPEGDEMRKRLIQHEAKLAAKRARPSDTAAAAEGVAKS